MLHNLPADQRADARLEIARKIGLPPEQLGALGEGPEVAGESDDPPLASNVIEQRFHVSGLQCPSCSWLVEHTLTSRPGVLEARVDFLTEIGTVKIDLRKTSREGALASLEAVGYRGRRLDDAVEADPERLRLRCAVAAMAAMNTMMLAFAHYAETFGATTGPWRSTIGAFGAALAVPAVAYGGGPIFRRALALLRHRRVAMETLLALGIFASMLLSLLAFVLPGAHFYFEIPTMIVATALGARLVDRAIRRSGARKVASLLRPRPVRVRRLGPDGAIIGFIGVDQLSEGRRVLVPEGEEVPADLEVMGEPVAVSEAVLTGEPRPQWKRLGATVLAGSVVVEGALEGEVLRPPEGSAHAQIGQQILDIVQGQSERTAVADQVASWFVLAILLVAASTVLFHGLVRGYGLAPEAWLPAIAVLVVACPCAFSIAASASMGTAAIRLINDGALLRSPEAFERAAKADVVVFDKTGTLTAGDMDVRSLEWLGEPDEALLAQVAALEGRSRHPMAAAIRRALLERGVVSAPMALVEVEELRGLGVRGRDQDGREVAVGAPALFSGSPAGELTEARPTVFFGVDGRPRGRIVFDDPLRPAAEVAVRRLRSLGVEVQLLSGDDSEVAARCAEALGIEVHEGRALPETKAIRVQALRAAGRRVVYVGDGINDAPALAAAEVGIALRHGASLALETADLLSVSDDPTTAPATIELARRLRRITIENYAWALGYNAILVPVAAAGLLHPTFSAVAMFLSSVTVLANSARLLWCR